MLERPPLFHEHLRQNLLRLCLILLGVLTTRPSLMAQAPSGAAPATTDPVRSEIELNQGIVEFELNRYAAALDRLSNVEPGDASAAYYRGLSLIALQRAKEAVGDLESVARRPGAPAEVKLDLAVAQLGAGQAPRAQTTLENYVKTHPEDPYGHYFLGVALFRQKRYPEATAELDRVADDTRFAPYLNFYHGLRSYAEGDGQHLAFLDEYQAAGATGPTADLTRRLLDGSAQPNQGPYRPTITPNGVQGPDPNRRWNLAVLSGYAYNTNVPLLPGLTSTPVGMLGTTGGRADSSWTLGSFGEYRLVQNENWVLGLIGSTYDTWQFRLDRFNFQDYMGGAYSNVALGRRMILGNRYEFHEDLLGGKQFASDHRLTPNFTIREGRDGTIGHITTYYEFEAIDISGLVYAAPALIRSGTIHSVGATQAFYLANGQGRLFLGFRHDQAFTAGSDFDRRSEQLDARIEYPLPFKMVGDIEARYFWDNYSNPNSLDFLNRARRDERIVARAGVQKFFTPHLSLRVEYVYTENDSNVTNLFGVHPYMYNQNLLNTQLIFDF
jgi:hypothetical protein